MRRKVSRVESLKRILFNRTENDEKKRRSKSAEAELKRSTVDKGCGPDMDAEDMYSAHARASCLDLSSEIGEFDSVSQISCMDNHDRSVLTLVQIFSWLQQNCVLARPAIAQEPLNFL